MAAALEKHALVVVYIVLRPLKAQKSEWSEARSRNASLMARKRREDSGAEVGAGGAPSQHSAQQLKEAPNCTLPRDHGAQRHLGLMILTKLCLELRFWACLKLSWWWWSWGASWRPRGIESTEAKEGEGKREEEEETPEEKRREEKRRHQRRRRGEEPSKPTQAKIQEEKKGRKERKKDGAASSTNWLHLSLGSRDRLSSSYYPTIIILSYLVKSVSPFAILRRTHEMTRKVQQRGKKKGAQVVRAAMRIMGQRGRGRLKGL